MWANLNLKSLQDKFQESLHDLESSLAAVAPPQVPPAPSTSSQPSSPSTARRPPVSVSTQQTPTRTNSGGVGIGGLPLSPTSLSNAQQSASQLADSALSSLRASLRKGRQSFDAARASLDGQGIVTSPTARRTTSMDSVRSLPESIKEGEMEDRGKGKGKLEELKEREEAEVGNVDLLGSFDEPAPTPTAAPVAQKVALKPETTAPEDNEEDEDAWGVGGGGTDEDEPEQAPSAAKSDPSVSNDLVDFSTPAEDPIAEKSPSDNISLLDEPASEPVPIDSASIEPTQDAVLSLDQPESIPDSPPKPLVNPVLATLQQESLEAHEDLTTDTPRPEAIDNDLPEVIEEEATPLDQPVEEKSGDNEEEEEDGWDLPDVEEDEPAQAETETAQEAKGEGISQGAEPEVEVEIEPESKPIEEEKPVETVSSEPKKLLDPLSEPFEPSATPPIDIVLSSVVQAPEESATQPGSDSSASIEHEEIATSSVTPIAEPTSTNPALDPNEVGPSDYPADIEDLVDTTTSTDELSPPSEPPALDDPLLPAEPLPVVLDSQPADIDSPSIPPDEPADEPESTSTVTEDARDPPNPISTSEVAPASEPDTAIESASPLPTVDIQESAPSPPKTETAPTLTAESIELVEEQIPLSSTETSPESTQGPEEAKAEDPTDLLDTLIVEPEQPTVEQPETNLNREKLILEEAEEVQEPGEIEEEAKPAEELQTVVEREEETPVEESSQAEPEVAVEQVREEDFAAMKEDEDLPKGVEQNANSVEGNSEENVGIAAVSSPSLKESPVIVEPEHEHESVDEEENVGVDARGTGHPEPEVAEEPLDVSTTADPEEEEPREVLSSAPKEEDLEEPSIAPSTSVEGFKAEPEDTEAPVLPPKDEPEASETSVPTPPVTDSADSLPPQPVLDAPTAEEALPGVKEAANGETESESPLVDRAIPQTPVDTISEKTVDVPESAVSPRARSVSVTEDQRFIELSASHEKLKTLKSSLDSLLSDLIPSISTVDDTEALGDELRNLKVKADMGMDEVRRMSGQLDQQKSRVEELRETHRLEHQSQQSEIDALRDSLAARNISLEEANDKLAAAEKSAEATRQEIVKAADEYDKLKLVAKEEEEKRVKALSLLRALRQKLVKNEQEKATNDQELEKSRKEAKDALDTLKSDRARFDKEIVALRTAHELQITKLRTGFEREAQGLKERFEKEAISKRGQFELDAIHVKASQAKELSSKDARIAQLEAAVKDLTKSRDQVFEEAQQKTEEIEATKADEAILRGRTSELEYEIQEAKDRIAALVDELEEVKRSRRETNRDDSNARKLLAETEARYELRIRELEARSKQLEKDRHETEEEMGRNMQDRLKEVERMRAALAQKDLDYAESVQNSQKREAKITEAEKAKTDLEKRLKNVEEMLKSVKDDADKAINAEIAVREELGDRVQRAAELEARLEEVQTKESTLRSNNKTLREELRKLQSGVLLSEKQRNPGVGYFSSFNSSSNGNPTSPNAVTPLHGPGQVISPAASVSSLASAATGAGGLSGNARANGSADEALNFEYMRNVILQFLEKPEMRPHLISVLGVILHFTPAESRRLIAKAGH
ncbi:hypothetical protein JCM16303_003352 [Sporobolomyces ruberrimus]